MNAYSTNGPARIQHNDISNILRSHAYMAGAAMEGLERQRSGQVDAELHSLLKRHGVEQASNLSMVRQMIGAGLVRAGQRLAGTTRGGVSPEVAPTVGSGWS